MVAVLAAVIGAVIGAILAAILAAILPAILGAATGGGMWAMAAARMAWRRGGNTNPPRVGAPNAEGDDPQGIFDV
jgi:uncharacterized membrane protein YfcA